MSQLRFTEFQSELDRILASDGKEVLPNIIQAVDERQGLNLIAKASNSVSSPYKLRIQNFDPPRRGNQTHSIAYFPKIFLNTAGMANQFDGSGCVLAMPSGEMLSQVFAFSFCEHDWDERGANHSRGWHPARCTKCGFDASIDSGD